MKVNEMKRKLKFPFFKNMYTEMNLMDIHDPTILSRLA